MNYLIIYESERKNLKFLVCYNFKNSSRTEASEFFFYFDFWNLIESYYDIVVFDFSEMLLIFKEKEVNKKKLKAYGFWNWNLKKVRVNLLFNASNFSDNTFGLGEVRSKKKDVRT